MSPIPVALFGPDSIKVYAPGGRASIPSDCHYFSIYPASLIRNG